MMTHSAASPHERGAIRLFFPDDGVRSSWRGFDRDAGDAEGDVSDQQDVAGREVGFLGDARAIERDAIHASQIAHDPAVIDLNQAAMPARDFGTAGEPDVAIGVSAEKNDCFVEQDGRPTRDRFEA